MKIINSKLNKLETKITNGETLKIAIMGLGGVGNYLLDYLMSWQIDNLEIHICGRSQDKISSDINIVRIANGIRHNNTKTIIAHHVDLENIDNIATALKKINPDFIINSSRAYSGLKYGSISWKNFRAYGIWSPLAAKFMRNIMIAYRQAKCSGIVINTSYSDAVIPWIKSAGLSYPDFGSGNVNHLISRIKLEVAEEIGAGNINNINIVLATSHFHNVLISKEGHAAGVEPLVHISHGTKELELDVAKIYKKCVIPMPVDSKRNMMNASSNFEIITKIINSIRYQASYIIHVPGIAGEIGGYPIRIDFREGASKENRISFVEDYFSIDEMRLHNRLSIALDGIEDVTDGVLTYTEVLRDKVKECFNVKLPKHVPFDKIEETAELLIEKIIKPAKGKDNQ